jgi:hypothetical protein
MGLGTIYFTETFPRAKGQASTHFKKKTNLFSLSKKQCNLKILVTPTKQMVGKPGYNYFWEIYLQIVVIL